MSAPQHGVLGGAVAFPFTFLVAAANFDCLLSCQGWRRTACCRQKRGRIARAPQRRMLGGAVARQWHALGQHVPSPQYGVLGGVIIVLLAFLGAAAFPAFSAFVVRHCRAPPSQ
jgi:hypothetical protein